MIDGGPHGNRRVRRASGMVRIEVHGRYRRRGNRQRVPTAEQRSRR